MARPIAPVFLLTVATTLATPIAPARACEPPPTTPAAVAMDAGATRDYHFVDIPVRSVLQLLAEEGGVNLVVADSVQGTVTLQLDDVTWDQALAIVLRLKGLERDVEVVRAR